MTDQERLDRIDELKERAVWLAAGFAETGPTPAEKKAADEAHEKAKAAAR